MRSLSFKTCKILNQILRLHNSLNQKFFKNKSLCKINFATMLCANKKVIMKNAVLKFKKILDLLKRLNLNNKIMSKGVVKFFNETKGFGFIIDTDSSKEYFVHVSGLVDKVKENDEVEFNLEEGRKGLNAVNVKLA